MATGNTTETPDQVHHLPNSDLPAVKQTQRHGKLPAGVSSIDTARERWLARPTAALPSPASGVQSLLKDIDEATRDLHAVASTTLKMVFLARDRMGLPTL